MQFQLAALALLAEDGPHNSGPDFGKASPFGLLVVVLLLIAVVFLVRSMNRHLKKPPGVTSWPGPPAPTFASTPTIRCTGDNGRRPRWPRPRNAMCPCCFRSAT